MQIAGANGVNSGNRGVSYNLVKVIEVPNNINSNLTALGCPMYMYRNFFLDGVLQKNVTSNNGWLNWYENVIVNESSRPDN